MLEDALSKRKISELAWDDLTASVMEYDSLGELSLTGSGGASPSDPSPLDKVKSKRTSGAAPKAKSGPGKKSKAQDLDLEAAQFKIKHADKYSACSTVASAVTSQLLTQLGKLDEAKTISLTETAEIPDGKPVITSGLLQPNINPGSHSTASTW